MSSPTGREILGRASAHLREAARNLEYVEVPEWQCRIYFRPALSVAQLQDDLAIYDAAEEHQIPALELARNALDEQGAHLFDQGDVAAIINETSAAVVGRVLDHIRERRREIIPPVATALGNSDGTPPRSLSSV